MILTTAERLEDVFKTFSPEPLRTPEELDAFYRGEVNEVRGRDVAALMRFGLQRTSRGAFYKSLLTGHSGVGKSTELTRLLRDVSDQWERVLGPEHPATANSLNNVASVMCALGDHAAAEPLYRRALTICQRSLGSKHPDTLRVGRNLLELLRRTGRAEEADALERTGDSGPAWDAAADGRPETPTGQQPEDC